MTKQEQLKVAFLKILENYLVENPFNSFDDPSIPADQIKALREELLNEVKIRYK